MKKLLLSTFCLLFVVSCAKGDSVPVGSADNGADTRSPPARKNNDQRDNHSNNNIPSRPDTSDPDDNGDTGGTVPPGEDIFVSEPTDTDNSARDAADPESGIDPSQISWIDEREGSEEHGLNDGYDDAKKIEPGEGVRGNIALGAQMDSQGERTEYDIDVFNVELTAGDIYRLAFTDVGDGFEYEGKKRVGVYLRNNSSNYRRLLLARYGRTREAFIPKTGTYQLVIFHEFATQSDPQTHGGPESTYELATQLRSGEPTDLSIPTKKKRRFANGVGFYSLQAQSQQPLGLSAIAQNKPVESSLDPILYVWDPDAGEVVAKNNDVSALQNADGVMDFSNLDSFIEFVPEVQKKYEVIVDANRNRASDSFEFRASNIDDAPRAPTKLSLGDVKSGQISDWGYHTADTDYYEVTLGPGQKARVTVTAASSTDFRPRLDVLDSEGDSVRLDPSLGTDGKAGVEFAVAEDAQAPETYLVTLNDVRNAPTGEDTAKTLPQNGKNYDYTISATDAREAWSSARKVEPPFVGSTQLSGVGETVWYEVDIPAQHYFSFYSKPRGDFRTNVVWRRNGAIETTWYGNTYWGAFDQEWTVEIGLREQYFRGGSTFGVDVEILTFDPGSATFNQVNEEGVHRTRDNAQTLERLPARIPGSVSAVDTQTNGRDVYEVRLGSAGPLFAVAEPDNTRENGAGDVLFGLKDSGGDPVVEENDIVVLTYLEAGNYYLTVRPKCPGAEDPEGKQCQGNGDYTLKVATPSL